MEREHTNRSSLRLKISNDSKFGMASLMATNTRRVSSLLSVSRSRAKCRMAWLGAIFNVSFATTWRTSKIRMGTRSSREVISRYSAMSTKEMSPRIERRDKVGNPGMMCVRLVQARRAEMLEKNGVLLRTMLVLRICCRRGSEREEGMDRVSETRPVI